MLCWACCLQPDGQASELQLQHLHFHIIGDVSGPTDHSTNMGVVPEVGEAVGLRDNVRPFRGRENAQRAFGLRLHPREGRNDFSLKGGGRRRRCSLHLILRECVFFF